MDLGGYAQIDSLENLMRENDISVPRLRGLRLMSEEEPLTKEDFNELYNRAELEECESACSCFFTLNANWSEYSLRTKALKHRYLDYERKEEDGYSWDEPVRVRWDRLHGKKRKVLKFEIKRRKRRIKKQYEMWNKYAGQDNILYIHARLGSGNWDYFNCNEIIASQPWYLDHCEDNFDGTYIDIYAKIK